MKWVTRENAHVERVSIPWLILRFIDKDAQFSFVPARTDPATVDGIPFDMPGAKLGHHNGKCSFEAVLEEYQLTDDAALGLMGEIIHGADIPMDADLSSESWGVRAIALGFMHKYGLADDDKINAQLEMYDALYIYCQMKTSPDGGYTAIP